MAARTDYLIRTTGRAYLATFHASDAGAIYAWTTTRAHAVRFDRAAALTVADALDAAIRANGYTVASVRIEPATGGDVVARA